MGGAPVAPSVMALAVVLNAARGARASRGAFAIVARNMVRENQSEGVGKDGVEVDEEGVVWCGE